MTEDYEWQAESEEIFAYRQHEQTGKTKVLINWQGLPKHEAT